MTDSKASGAAPLPLAGWRVLVPRPADRASELSDALRTAGAEPVTVPLISIEPLADSGAFDLALVELARSTYAWVGFTSANAVDAVLSRADELALRPAVPGDTRVAAVGPATASALRGAGLPVDLLPAAGGSAAALAQVWPRATGDAAVLLPRSDLAPPTLPQALAAKGYRVEAVTAYRTVSRPVPPAVSSGLSAGDFDAVILTAPSTVTALESIDIAASTVLCAIGRPTDRAARAAGRTIAFTARDPTAGALVDGLIGIAQTQRPSRRTRAQR